MFFIITRAIQIWGIIPDIRASKVMLSGGNAPLCGWERRRTSKIGCFWRNKFDLGQSYCQLVDCVSNYNTGNRRRYRRSTAWPRRCQMVRLSTSRDRADIRDPFVFWRRRSANKDFFCNYKHCGARGKGNKAAGLGLLHVYIVRIGKYLKK